MGYSFEDAEAGLSLKALFGIRLFWILMIMMICPGTSEQAVSQWASAFAEKGLGISKTAGDLAGPMAFLGRDNLKMGILAGIDKVYC